MSYILAHDLPPAEPDGDSYVIGVAGTVNNFTTVKFPAAQLGGGAGIKKLEITGQGIQQATNLFESAIFNFTLGSYSACKIPMQISAGITYGTLQMSIGFHLDDFSVPSGRHEFYCASGQTMVGINLPAHIVVTSGNFYADDANARNNTPGGQISLNYVARDSFLHFYNTTNGDATVIGLLTAGYYEPPQVNPL